MTDHPLHDPADPSTAWALSPWVPMSRPIDLKHLGKLGEELAECGAAVSRCIIQGIAAAEPVTGKPNRQWLEEELADVLANTQLVIDHFDLSRSAIGARIEKKRAHLKGWHAMLAEPPAVAEVSTLRRVVSQCADAVGAFVSETASLEFIEKLPSEIALAVARLKRRAA